MTRLVSRVSGISATRLVYGFLAAVMATLIFHQIGLLLLHFAGMTPGMPYDTRPTPPFGVPRVISLAFWGGLWGIVFVLAERYIARSPGGYWVGAIIFGAIIPDVVSWFIVAPLKGLPVGYGFSFRSIATVLIVDGLWGFGTAVFLSIRPNVR